MDFIYYRYINFNIYIFKNNVLCEVIFIQTTYIHGYQDNWGDKYLTTNVFIKDNNSHILPIGRRYTLINGKYKTNVLAFGFLYDFKEYSDGVLIKPVKSVIKSKWFIKTLLKYKVDIIVIVAHMSLRSTEVFDIITLISNQSIFWKAYTY